jgi:hypothetical protein
MQNGVNHSTRNTFANQKLNLCMAGRSVLEEEVRKRRERNYEKRRRESMCVYRCSVPPYLADYDSVSFTQEHCCLACLQVHFQCISFSLLQAGSCMHIHVPGVSVTECPRCLAGEPVSLLCTYICTTQLFVL